MGLMVGPIMEWKEVVFHYHHMKVMWVVPGVIFVTCRRHPLHTREHLEVSYHTLLMIGMCSVIIISYVVNLWQCIVVVIIMILLLNVCTFIETKDCVEDMIHILHVSLKL